MGRLHHNHGHLHLQHRSPDPNANAESAPLAQLLDATVVRLHNLSKRGATGSDDSDTCTKGDKSDLCTKPAESNNITLPVLLGVL